MLCQPYTGPWSKIRDKNLRMRKIFNSKSPPKVHACADSCRDFLTTDLKFPVHDVVQEQSPIVFHHNNMASVHPSICLWVHDKQPGIHCTGFAYGSTTSNLEFTVQGLPMDPRQAAWNSLYRVCLWVHDKQPGIHCTGFAYGSTTSSLEFTVQGLPMGPPAWNSLYRVAYGSTTSSLEFTVQGLPMGPRQAAWNPLYRVCLWVHDKQPGIHCTGFAYMGPRHAAWNPLYRVCLWVHDKQPGIHCTGFSYGSTTSSLEFTVQGLPMDPRQAAWNSLYRVCLWVHDKQPGIHCTGFAYGSTTSSLEFTVQGLPMVPRQAAWNSLYRVCRIFATELEEQRPKTVPYFGT